MRFSRLEGGRSDVSTLVEILTDQWQTIRPYVTGLSQQELEQNSVLEGWAVRDIVHHFAEGLQKISTYHVVRGQKPQTWGDLLAGYAVNEDTGTITLPVQSDASGDIVEDLDRAWHQAVEQVSELVGLSNESESPDIPVVRGCRGVITLTDLLGSEILELVVHTDDIARSLGQQTPVSSDALQFTVEGLLAALEEYLHEEAPSLSVSVEIPELIRWSAGPSLLLKGNNSQRLAAWDWVRVAAGRVEWQQVADLHGVSLEPFLPIVP